MSTFHTIFTGLSLVIVALSINRLSSFTLSPIGSTEFLRWVDLFAMIPIPLVSILIYYFLWKKIRSTSTFIKTRVYTYLFLVFLTGVFLLGVSSGNHEVTNYLNTRFCHSGILMTPLCTIVGINDDIFSHVIYYLGIIALNLSLIFLEFNIPRRKEMTPRDILFVSLNALFIGLGIFANLAFEEIGLDLYFFGVVSVAALFVLVRKRIVKRLPVSYYFAFSYTFGVVGTLLYKMMSR